MSTRARVMKTGIMTSYPTALMASPGATEKMPISITGKALKRARNKGCRMAGRQRGFSLIELMIVLVIMAIVMGMAAPRIAKNMAAAAPAHDGKAGCGIASLDPQPGAQHRKNL